MQGGGMASAVGSREFAAALSVMNPRGRCETTRTVRILSSPVPADGICRSGCEIGGVGGEQSRQ